MAGWKEGLKGREKRLKSWLKGSSNCFFGASLVFRKFTHTVKMKGE